MVDYISSAARNARLRRGPNAHQWRLLVIGVILAVLATALVMRGLFSLETAQIASFGSVLAFAVFAYSEALAWRDPLTEGHSLVLVIWFGIAFPVYLLTTTSRRPVWLTTLLIAFLLVDLVVGLFALNSL